MQLYEVLNFLENSSFINQIELSKIPNINLYMDQALTFMNENLEYYKRNPNDKIITKSMINNYVKNNIIPKPENKKYFPHHIISLIYIFYLKQILSLDDVKTILSVYSEKHFKLDDMSQLYKSFLSIEKSEEKKLEEEINDLINNIYSNKSLEKFDDDEKLFLVLMLFASRANTYKVIIEKLLDFNNNSK